MLAQIIVIRLHMTPAFLLVRGSMFSIFESELSTLPVWVELLFDFWNVLKTRRNGKQINIHAWKYLLFIAVNEHYSINQCRIRMQTPQICVRSKESLRFQSIPCIVIDIILAKKNICDPSQQNRAVVCYQEKCDIPFIWKSILLTQRWYHSCVNWMQHCNFMVKK